MKVLNELKSILGELDKTELLLDQFLLCFHSNYQNKSGSKTVLRQESFSVQSEKKSPNLNDSENMKSQILDHLSYDQGCHH